VLAGVLIDTHRHILNARSFSVGFRQQHIQDFRIVGRRKHEED